MACPFTFPIVHILKKKKIKNNFLRRVIGSSNYFLRPGFAEPRGLLGGTEHACKPRPARPGKGQGLENGPVLYCGRTDCHRRPASRSSAPGTLASSDAFPKPAGTTRTIGASAPTALPHPLPVLAGRGGLRPSVLAPQAAHAPSSWRLGSASPGRLCARVESAPARSLGGSPPPPPLPLTPRGGSGPGGTMFTSTGSSGLCEYRLLHPWGSLRSVLGTSRTRLGGPGDPALQKARGPLASRVRALAVLGGGQRVPSPPQPRRPRGAPRPVGSRHLPRHGAQQLLPCCRWAGQLGSGRLPRCSRGSGPRTPLMTLVRGWTTSPSGRRRNPARFPLPFHSYEQLWNPPGSCVNFTLPSKICLFP